MELTKRMIEEYLKSSKKNKSEMITQHIHRKKDLEENW